MNVLFLSLLYPEDTMTEVERNVKDKLQNQINTVEHAILDGMKACLSEKETLTVINALPVGIYPKCYRRLIIPRGWHDNHQVFELGCINLPAVKQKMRQKRAEKEIVMWASQDKNNRTVLLYTIYLPYLKAVLNARKKYPDLKAAVIVTDLPNQYSLPSGRTGLLKRIEYALGRQTFEMASRLDGYILMSRYMSGPLHVDNKPILIMEGLIQPESDAEAGQSSISFRYASDKPIVLYTGTLEPDLGIGDLLEIFQRYQKAELWICGSGRMQKDVEEASLQYDNIRFLGRIPHREAVILQRKANLLVNPRKPDHEFTKYSFPSKTLEYLLSGTPVLCYRLDGIPEEYDSYLHYFDVSKGLDGMIDSIDGILFCCSDEEREQMRIKQTEFVLKHKNAQAQSRRIIDFLREL